MLSTDDFYETEKFMAEPAALTTGHLNPRKSRTFLLSAGLASGHSNPAKGNIFPSPSGPERL
jgi:hypothetical protein